MGGALPLPRALLFPLVWPWLVRLSDSSRIRAAVGWTKPGFLGLYTQAQMAPLCLGGIHSREGSQAAIFTYSLAYPPRWPPKCSGTVRGSRRASHRFIWTFLGDVLVVVIVLFTVDYLFTRVHVFFPEIVPRRN